MLSLSLRSTRSSDYSGTRPGEPGGAGSHLGARLGVCVPSLSEGMLMVLTRSYLRFHEFQGPPCFHLFFQILPPPTSAPQRPPLEVMLQAHLLHETFLCLLFSGTSFLLGTLSVDIWPHGILTVHIVKNMLGLMLSVGQSTR